MINPYILAQYIQDKLNLNGGGMEFEVAVYNNFLDSRKRINESNIKNNIIPAIISSPLGTPIPIKGLKAERGSLTLEIALPISEKKDWLEFANTFIYSLNGEIKYLYDGVLHDNLPEIGTYSTIKITCETPTFGELSPMNTEVWNNISTYLPIRRTEVYMMININFNLKIVDDVFVGDEFNLAISNNPSIKSNYYVSTQEIFDLQKNEYKTIVDGTLTNIEDIIDLLNSIVAVNETQTISVNGNAVDDGSISFTIGGETQSTIISTYVAPTSEIDVLTYLTNPTTPGSFTVSIDGNTRTFYLTAEGGTNEQVTYTVNDELANSGSFTITLAGISKTTVSMIAGLSAEQAAQAIEALSFVGWVNSRIGASVTFTNVNLGDIGGTNSANVGSTGTTISVSVINGTSPHVASAYDTKEKVATLVASGDFPGFSLVASGASVTFTANAIGEKTPLSVNNGSTGLTSSIVRSSIGTEEEGSSKISIADAIANFSFSNWVTTRISDYVIQFSNSIVGTSNSLDEAHSGVSLTITGINGYSAYDAFANIKYHSTTNDEDHYFINNNHFLNLKYVVIKGMNLQIKNARMVNTENFLNDQTGESYISANDVKYTITAYFSNEELIKTLFENLANGDNPNQIYWTRLHKPFGDDIYKPCIIYAQDAVLNVDDFATIPLIFAKAFKELI